MMMRTATFLTAALVATFAARTPLPAQTNPISCPTGFQPISAGACSATIPAGKSTDQTELRVNVRAEGGAVVRFRVVSGGGSVVPDSVALASSGSVGTFWSRPHATTNAVVLVELVTRNGNAVRALELVAPKQPASEQVRLVTDDGNRQEWFENRGLRYPLVTRIDRRNGAQIVDPSTCERYKVVYQRRAGAVTELPDTAPARVARRVGGTAPDTLSCLVYGNASLGAGAGDRYIDADLIGPEIADGEGHELFRVHARALPRLVTGLGVTQIRRVSVLESGAERKGKITRVRADSSTFEVDTTFNGPGSVGREGGTEPVLMVGLTSPIPVGFLRQRLNVMIGVDPARPASSIFGGISLLNLITRQGASGEALPIGVYGLVNYQRIKVLDNPTLCAAPGGTCEQSTRGFRGWSLMLTYDAGDALSALVKKLTG
jgi:hypothetical protein